MARLTRTNPHEPEVVELPCGIPLAVCHKPGPVDCFGIAINVGSRDEKPGDFGLAHFVEHTIFKGTMHRRAAHIIKRMEAVGGELNAFTSKEETNIYSVFPHGNLTRAAELIADLALNSQFPSKELEKERDVVRDEIDSYLDQPSEAIYDDFEDLAFAGSQLGHNILGTTNTLDSFTSEKCREYTSHYYVPGRIYAYFAGGMSASRVAETVAKAFSEFAFRKTDTLSDRILPPLLPPFQLKKAIDSHQTHSLIGCRIGGVYSPSRYALGLLTNMLGGPGMNSRLNVALRERRGLVYSVEASTSLWSDCGLFTIYYGCDPHDDTRCRSLVLAELERASEEALSPRALDGVKKQYLGQLLVANDGLEATALAAGRSMLYHHRPPSLSHLQEVIKYLTPDDILEAARELLPANMSSLSFV